MPDALFDDPGPLPPESAARAAAVRLVERYAIRHQAQAVLRQDWDAAVTAWETVAHTCGWWR